MAQVTVMYPQGTKFDMDYYKSSHMPLAKSKWADYGMKSYDVLQFKDDAPFCVQATLKFDSMDQIGKAMASSHTKEVLDDVKNFSDKEPTILAGPVVASD